MATTNASASDVEGVIEVDLSDVTPTISDFIDDAAFEAEQAISDYQNALTTEEKTQLEKYLAALKIREWADRAYNNTSRETASISYEGMALSALKREVDKRDPSGTLAYSTDSNRYVNSAP